MRVDQQRAAIERAHHTRATIEQIKQYLANAEVQAARDAALIQQAREDAVAGHQRFTELRHEEQMREAQEAAERAAEAAEQERLNSRSWLERRSDTLRERMQPQSEEK